jgi:hypothetical protein
LDEATWNEFASNQEINYREIYELCDNFNLVYSVIAEHGNDVMLIVENGKIIYDFMNAD